MCAAGYDEFVGGSHDRLWMVLLPTEGTYVLIVIVGRLDTVKYASALLIKNWVVYTDKFPAARMVRKRRITASGVVR